MWLCPMNECDGSGLLYVDDDDGGVSTGVPCRCRQQMIVRARTRRLSSHIPKRFQGAGWDRFPVTEIDPGLVAYVREYATNIGERLDRGAGLWLEGATGTGKTTLAMLVCRAAVDAGRSIATYSVPRLLQEIRDTFDDDRGTADLLGRLARVDLLHLDDLGAEKRTEWVLEQLYTLVDARYEAERSVIVTTNIVDRDTLEAQVGERTASRLTEMCEQYTLVGNDMRGRVWS